LTKDSLARALIRACEFGAGSLPYHPFIDNCAKLYQGAVTGNVDKKVLGYYLERASRIRAVDFTKKDWNK
jgi:hypothetical protein